MGKIFTLAGMHRSGTSLVANWLHDSGIFMGENLLGSASSNQKGHFEDVDILEIQKKDLREKGYHESGLLIENNQWNLSIDNRSAIDKIIEERSKKRIWGWKEPRTTLYLKEWKKIIPELKVISVYREPELVIQSLYTRLKRNKWYYTRNPLRRLCWFFDIDMNPRKWYKIFSETYYLYNKEILEFDEMYPEDSLIINLNQFIEREENLSNKINDFLGTRINFIPFSTIYDKSLLKQHIPGLPLQRVEKSKEIFRLLEERIE